MRATEPTVSRFDAFSRMISRLVAALFTFALLASTPLVTTSMTAAELPVCQSVAHASICIQNDADAVVLPAETRDEFDRTQSRPVDSVTDSHFLLVITSVAVSFLQTAPDVGHLRRPALPPPGRGPPILA